MIKTSTSNKEVPFEEDDFLLSFLPGKSAAVRKTRAMIARLNLTKNQSLVRVITIVGESGVGKNHLARVIAGHRYWTNFRNTDGDLGLDAGLNHYTSEFAEIHLPGLPETLVESELFGHMKGAFTGAGKDTPGLFGSGYKDILLDEVGDASPVLQSKLLAVIDTGKYRRVGDTIERENHSRIMLATNRDLSEMTSRGEFREDLLWRTRELVITVPSLRQQPENIAPIIRKIEAEFNERRAIDRALQLTDKDVKWATKQKWPGNIRQLRHAIKQWMFEDGKKAFSNIVKELDSGITPSGSAKKTMMLKQFIFSRLDDISTGKAEPLENLNDIVKEAEVDMKKAIVEWYDANKPDGTTIKKMFRACKLKAFRNKISEWRNS